ncbi:Histone transcription regulator 3 [Apiospora arundinis]|uniref:Histone transcription regulator 3 homolog n=1 Tax=Apiospora arundinis TaxID=335852 RepID=A0ABR2I905_9PEZI
MPAFTPLNVEPEENIDDEVDITRELHIEEALRRYQTALKLHAQGPQQYTEAADAYDDLFKSEIFQYPEAQTEFDRAERHSEAHNLPLDISFAQSLEVTQADIDGTGSSLPQALYLAYKNHGQFELDGIKYKVRGAGQGKASVFEQEETLRSAHKALCDYATALDHDPSDAELWRKAARVAAFLKSARASRYCLEAAIELDDDPTVDEVEPPSLAEGFSGEQLREQLHVLSDDMALSHPIMAPYNKKVMPAALKRYLDPIPYLPDPTKSLAMPKGANDDELNNLPPLVLNVPTASWADLGMTLVHFVATHGVPGTITDIELPELPDTPEPAEKMLVERPKLSEEAADGTSGEEVGDNTSQTISPDDAMESPKEGKVENTITVGGPRKERSGSVTSRKRSQSAAGLQPDGETEEVVEKRSKRTRRRETVADEPVEAQNPFAAQLEPYQAADKNLFQNVRNIAENLGVTDRGMLDRLAEILELSDFEKRTAKVTKPAMVDLRDSLTAFDEDIARVLLSKKEATSAVGFSLFLEHSKPGSQSKAETTEFDETKNLKAFAARAKQRGMGIGDIAFEWVRVISETYVTSKWSDSMKTAVVQVISHLDEDIYSRMQHEFEDAWTSEDPQAFDSVDAMTQMLFELHLDVYERITNPNSAVDFGIRVETRGRLGRWFSFAAELSQRRPTDRNQALSVRFLWASVFLVTLTEGVSREHILQCWQSLRESLASDFDGISPRLPNNAIMPEISIFAADKEISKLTTMDFFLGLFQNDLSDPVSVIDSLEPVLNPDAVYTVETPGSSAGSPMVDEQPSTPEPDEAKQQPISETASQGLRDLWKFLLGASTEMRLFLWNRLDEAYQAISYKTKEFSCKLKAIEMVVNDFERDPYLSMPLEDRRGLFFKMLKFVDDLLVNSLALALNEPSAFDIIDDSHFRSSIAALVKLSCLLHTSSVYEDEVRVGMLTAPTSNPSFSPFLNKLREMQVRNWSLLYTVLKAGVNQNRLEFTQPETDLAEYLAAVHQVLGLRKFCKSSNKIFLKMMRVELLKQNLVDNWEDYLGQVLFDLYGLKGIGTWEVEDHNCPAEKMDRRNAAALVEKIIVLANHMSMKDLLKSDLKGTIEHMQQAIGQTKSNQQTIHNLRNFTEFLKKPVHPLRLYQALKGGLTIDAVAVNTPDSSLARHGWFFLLGMIAFSKFKGVDLNRRQTPGATDDLRIGATFLRQQLQFTPDQWDAWFRLAECFDYELDESVLWTADKMNKERAELVKYQRNAIHCYTLALSHSWKALPEPGDTEGLEAIHELYHKFGMRMYASSREPFAMEPFQHSDHERFFIQNSMGGGTYKRIIHEQMDDYKVWKYAARLFRKAMEVKPKEWKNSYMRAKCIWKMYQKDYTTLDHYDRQSRPSVEQLIRALEQSVEAVWALPKPRSGTDPVLEPHYKIVSVVYKLVARGDLEPQEAADILQRQPFAIKKGAKVEINDTEDWEPFIIETLAHLKDKDKSNWQHRIIMRHARLLFDDKAENPEVLQALSAFQVLQKTMFTKTMVMNVWKCDAERPGRHHVYTEQYVRFMVKLLVTLKDRTNFEALLRRIRKKGGDFYHFNDLWQTCCIAYLRMIRQHYKIQPIIDDVYKNTSQEEFEIIAERITEWSTDANTSDHSAFEALKEAVELKKLNSALMKAGAVDDLIYDSYTAFYFDVGKNLPGPPLEVLIKERTEANKIKKGEIEKEKEKDKKPANPFTALLNPQSVENSGTDAAGPAASTHEASTRPRRAGVRRPDLLRKAEQAVMRAIDGPAKPTREKSRASVSSSKSRNHSRTPTGEAAGGHHGGGEDGDVEMKDHEEGHESSPGPGSLHDSADDESDLSDVPDDILDDEEAALLFPGLIRRNTQEAEEGDEEDEEDEEGDGDADDEEEEHEDGEEEVEAMEHDGEEEDHHDHDGAEEGEEHDEEEEEEEDPDETGGVDQTMQDEEDEDEEMGEGHDDHHDQTAADEDLEEEEEDEDEDDGEQAEEAEEDEELEDEEEEEEESAESETGDTIEAVVGGGPMAQR